MGQKQMIASTVVARVLPHIRRTHTYVERTPDKGGRDGVPSGSDFRECIPLYLHQVT